MSEPTLREPIRKLILDAVNGRVPAADPVQCDAAIHATRVTLAAADALEARLRETIAERDALRAQVAKLESQAPTDRVQTMLAAVDEYGAGSMSELTGGGKRDVFVLVAVDEEAHRLKAVYDRDGEADACESCGRRIVEGETCHVWADGVLTCGACGGPEDQNATSWTSL